MKKFIRKKIYTIIQFCQKQYKYYQVERWASKGTLLVGEGTYGINNITIDTYEGSEAKVIIGKYCSISKDVRFITGGIHPSGHVSLYPIRVQFAIKEGLYEDGIPSTKGDIKIGSDVWIGTGATILSGVTIGDGAIIFANAMVTKDVAPYSIVGGVPARVIKYRFENEIIQSLLKISWWNWDKQSIKDNVHLLSSDNIDLFVKKHISNI